MCGDVIERRLGHAEAGEASLGGIDQTVARVVHRTRGVATPRLSQHPGHDRSLRLSTARLHETPSTFCSMTDFADRYDDGIARGMIDAGSAAGGLPGYLGIEHVRFEPGRFFATAKIDRKSGGTGKGGLVRVYIRGRRFVT